MKTWLRLTLVVMTVGGGFTGAAMTLQFLFPSHPQPVSTTIIVSVFLLINLFILTAGLIFVQNSRITDPLVAALALQIPVLSSPLILYEFGVGLYLSVGISGTHLFYLLRFGMQWQFWIMHQSPWGFGVNLVPAFLVVAIKLSQPRESGITHEIGPAAF
jgi:hypothetical protein